MQNWAAAKYPAAPPFGANHAFFIPRNRSGDGSGTLMSIKSMTEPASTTLGGFLLYKLAISLIAVAVVLATIVVMAMTIPKTVKEFVVALICTVMCSLCGGAFIVMHMGLISWVNDYVGIVALSGIVFACGLPAWVLVRAFYAYAEIRSNGTGFIDMIREIKQAVWK